MTQKESQVQENVGQIMGRAMKDGIKEGLLEPMRMMGMGSKTRWGKIRWRATVFAMTIGLACVPFMLYDQVGVETVQGRVEVVAVKSGDEGLMGHFVRPWIELKILEGDRAGEVVARGTENALEYTPGQELVMRYRTGRLTDTVVLVDLIQTTPGH